MEYCPQSPVGIVKVPQAWINWSAEQKPISQVVVMLYAWYPLDGIGVVGTDVGEDEIVGAFVGTGVSVGIGEVVGNAVGAG